MALPSPGVTDAVQEGAVNGVAGLDPRHQLLPGGRLHGAVADHVGEDVVLADALRAEKAALGFTAIPFRRTPPVGRTSAKGQL